ncbi:MarR family winged helix-turn-helix transcriptional regulator [Penaeicola halotolerans]|uniref:MarR family winged helix-turn-helix transcriptional regulator n=1 Tax=Penaeicola halotolerans TaxID=2793196 RepID=UPI001CF7FA5D|nr:MarR family winged helix-turn-helix transcriptional regulator [Penaeicola halotolerans]
MTPNKMTSYLPLIEKWEEYLSLNAEGNLADFGKWLVERESSKQSYAIEHQSTANKDAVAGYLIARLYKFIRLYSKELLHEINIHSLDDFGFLSTIDRIPGIQKKVLCEINLIELSTGYDIIKRLQKEGWIIEDTDPNDKRAKTLMLSESGKLKVREAYMKLDSINEVLIGMDASAKSDMIQQLSKLNQAHSEKLK